MFYILFLCEREALLFDFVKCVANWFEVFELTDIYFSSFRENPLYGEMKMYIYVFNIFNW
jgi:hypothetical protein